MCRPNTIHRQKWRLRELKKKYILGGGRYFIFIVQKLLDSTRVLQNNAFGKSPKNIKCKKVSNRILNLNSTKNIHQFFIF